MLLKNYLCRNSLQTLSSIAIIISLLFVASLREGSFSKKNNPANINTSAVKKLAAKHFNKEKASKIKIRLLSRGIWSLAKSNKKTMDIICSTITFDQTTGYAGPIPMLIHLDNNYNIQDIKILPNRETPSFINKIIDSGFLKNWKNKPIKDALQKNVDTISGATMSSTAIIASIHQTLSKLQKKDIALLPKIQNKKLFSFLGLGLVIALAFYLSYSSTKHRHKLRIILLLLDVLVIGFFSGQFLSLSTFMTWIKSSSPSLMGILLLTLTVIIPSIFGKKKFYCNWICPYGAAQELIGKIIPRKMRISPGIINYLIKIREFILIIFFLLLSLGSSAIILNYEPFTAFMIPFASLPVIILAAGFLLISLFINRPWCRFFCPTGALLSHLSGKSKPKQQ